MKIGIIGLGRRMSAMLRKFKQAAPDLVVAGVVDDYPEKARLEIPDGAGKDAPFFESLKALVKATSPDAIAIGTRCDSHAELAIEAARYGLPVFLEKPVATNLAQAIELERAYLKSKSPVLVSFPLRATTLCQHAKCRLDQGAVGRPEHFLAVNYVAYGDVYFKTWFRDYSVTQGLFLQKATHDFDYLTCLLNSRVARVAAMTSVGRVYQDSRKRGTRDSHEALFFEDIGTPASGMNEDSSSALLELADGTKGAYTQMFFSKRMPKRGVTISGIKGSLEFDWYTNQIKTTWHQKPFSDVLTIEGDDDHFGGDTELARNFMAMARNNEPSIAPLGAGLASVYACLAAKQSAETGQFVNVRPTKLPC